jgi:hypothetical protein
MKYERESTHRGVPVVLYSVTKPGASTLDF